MSGDGGAARHVLENADQVARAAAEWMCERLGRGAGPLRVCLSGGSTPRHLYELLAGPDFAPRMAWDRIDWYWGDERCVPLDHPDSNYRMARESLLDRAPIAPDRVHPIRTEGLSPEEAARDYGRLLRAAQGPDRSDPARPFFAVTLLGLGEDGHTASLLPGSAALDETKHWAVAVEHGRPQARITLTYPALNSSAAVALLVAGAGKRAALAAVWAGDVSMPAARIRPVGELHWFVDRAAAGQGG